MDSRSRINLSPGTSPGLILVSSDCPGCLGRGIGCAELGVSSLGLVLDEQQLGHDGQGRGRHGATGHQARTSGRRQDGFCHATHGLAGDSRQPNTTPQITYTWSPVIGSRISILRGAAAHAITSPTRRSAQHRVAAAVALGNVPRVASISAPGDAAILSWLPGCFCRAAFRHAKFWHF